MSLLVTTGVPREDTDGIRRGLAFHQPGRKTAHNEDAALRRDERRDDEARQTWQEPLPSRGRAENEQRGHEETDRSNAEGRTEGNELRNTDRLLKSKCLRPREDEARRREDNDREAAEQAKE